MSSKVADSLKKVLADSYTLYLKTQNYHWNVTGSNFQSLHTLFEVQYNDLFLAVDLIAERIRALGYKAPGSFKAYTSITKIEDGNEDASAEEMVKGLADDQGLIIKTLNEALKEAQAQDDEGTIGLLVDRITIHEKNIWMLRSSI